MLSTDVKELFLGEVILHQFLKWKKWALLGKIVQAILILLNLAQKAPVKNQIKNVFCGNQIFTKFYLGMGIPIAVKNAEKLDWDTHWPGL